MSESSDDAHAHADTENGGESGDVQDDGGESEDVRTLRREVEERYDFENFGPAEMAEMEPEEWEAAFDPDTWITGEALLDRVEAELLTRVAERDVFARVERFDGVLVAYSDTGDAAVSPDGSVEGEGTVLRDVKPTVALCSMDSYDVADPPEGTVLPSPDQVTERSATLGNTVLQVVAGIQILAGVVILGALLLAGTGLFQAPGLGDGMTNFAIAVVAAIGFLLIGVFLFVTVANARLSDRFRAAEYRDRLRAVGLEDGQRPPFLDEIDGVDLELQSGGGDPRGGNGGDPGTGDATGDGGESATGDA